MTFHDGVAARTLWGECRGESDEGKLAVAHVIRNRVKSGRWGHTPASVCMAPAQFSCWLSRDPNFRKMLDLAETDVDLVRCAAAWLLSLTTDDPTNGAKWYHVVGTFPSWMRDKRPSVSIGHHSFYSDID